VYLVRSLLPFLLLLAGNLILGGCGVVGILIAAVIDIIAILVLYSSKKDLQQIVDTAVRLGRFLQHRSRPESGCPQATAKTEADF